MTTTICGSDGEFEVDDDGYPTGDVPEGYSHIERVDVKEAREFYGVIEPSIDILCVGYWHTTGYEPPVAELRGR